jgi:hypothetical protein
MIARRALCLLVVITPTTAAAQWQAAPAQAAQQQPIAGVPPQGTAPASPAPATPSPYDPSMQAGGLTPPPPMQAPSGSASPPPSGGTTRQLEEAKKEDSGRGLELVWINVEGGFENVGLSTFNVDEEELTAGFISTSSSGGMVGAGVGLRLVFITLGARGRVGFFNDWQIFSLGGELGAHIPLGVLDPHVDLGFGYAGLGSFDSVVTGAADAITIRGFYGRVSGGLDLYVSPAFSLGLNASWEFLGLTRPGLSTGEIQRIKEDPSTNPEQTKADLLATEGTSYGSAFALTGVAGLHF